MSDLAKDFERDGYVIIENAVDPTDLEDTITRLANKLLAEKAAEPSTVTRLNLRTLALEYKPEFHKLGSNVGASLAGLNLLSNSIISQALLDIVGPNAFDLFLMPLNLFFNDKGSERLHYDFHQESVAFPTVRNNYHLWTPLFKDMEPDDGPMVVLKGSHKRVLPYTAVENPNGITQLHIEPSLLEGFERVVCNFKRGTVIIFDKNLVHTSGTNVSGMPRVAAAARFLDLLSEERFEPYVQYYFTTEKSRKAVKGE